MTTRVTAGEVTAESGSALTLETIRVEPRGRIEAGTPEEDVLLYVATGSGSLELAEMHRLSIGSAALVLAGEVTSLQAGDAGIVVVAAAVGPSADRHAQLGPREHVVELATAETRRATGARSYQVLFGPENGSTRATLFAGFIPPGRAPWHYHLYDEIVWVPDGPGVLHLGQGTESLGAGSSFRLHPREVHVVENSTVAGEMMVVGVFTPAGSPSAAYLTPEVAAEYRFAG
jgi:quercetin dioxygenase-like cupin family protein